MHFSNNTDSAKSYENDETGTDDNVASYGHGLTGKCINNSRTDLKPHLQLIINCNEYENVGESFDIIAKELRKVCICLNIFVKKKNLICRMFFEYSLFLMRATQSSIILMTCM